MADKLEELKPGTLLTSSFNCDSYPMMVVSLKEIYRGRRIYNVLDIPQTFTTKDGQEIKTYEGPGISFDSMPVIQSGEELLKLLEGTRYLDNCGTLMESHRKTYLHPKGQPKPTFRISIGSAYYARNPEF
jgi:hypothetical protein